MPVIAPVAMVFGSLVLYWARWPLTGKVIVLMAAGLPIWAWYELRKPWAELKPHLKAGTWMIAYLLVMAAVSWAGSTEYGGQGYIPEGADLALVAVLALVFYYWGVRSAWANPSLAQVREELAQAAAEQPEPAQPAGV